MDRDQMIARIAELEKTLANKSAKGTSLRVSVKGGVSFYGVGRYPVTLYASQWNTLFEHAEAIKGFIATNSALLAEKPAKTTEVSA